MNVLKKYNPIVFLHLPKTAGQSFRIFLREAFPKRKIFPGQLDHHLALCSRKYVQEFDIFTGHFSWALLDALGSDAHFITILRDPVDRVISFYTYLRRQGLLLSKSELDRPQNRGLKAAASSPFEVFLNHPDPEIREYVKLYFDNFYMYYFATRMNGGRSQISDHHPPNDHFVLESVMYNAIENLEKYVSVYSINSLNSLQEDMSKLEGYVPSQIVQSNVSGRETTNISGMLPALCDDLTLAREQIHLNCHFDMTIFRRFCE